MKKIFLLSLYSLAIIKIAAAQWTQTGPYTSVIKDLSVCDSGIFAAAAVNGVYFSSDPSSGWVFSNGNIPVPVMATCVASKDSVVFISGNDAMILRSKDYGSTWTNIAPSPSLYPNLQLWDICFSQQNITALTNAGLFTSDDTGSTWTARPTQLSPYYMNYLYPDDSVIYVLSRDSGLLRTTDYGLTWSLSHNGFYPSCQVHCMTRKDSLLYIGTWCGEVHKSSDNGLTWTSTGMGPWQAINCLAVCGNKLCAGTIAGFYFSVNNGATWTQLNTGLSDLFINCMEILNNDIIVGTNSGVYILHDNSTSWIPVSNGIRGGYFTRITSGDGFVYTVDNVSGVFYSLDHGDTWNIKNTGLGTFDVCMLESAGDAVYIGNFLSGMKRTSNSISYWENVQGGLTSTTHMSVLKNGSSVFAGARDGSIFKSDNNGITWNFCVNNNPGDVNLILAANSTHIFAAYNSLIYSSYDNGSSWSFADTVIGLSHLAATSDAVIAVINSNFLLASNDNGLTWSNLNFPVTPNILYVSDIMTIGSDVFVSSNKGVHYSADNGSSWTEINTGLILPDCITLGNDGEYLFVSTAITGGFRQPIMQITGKNNSEKVSAAISVFPNPSCNELNVSFTKGINKIEIIDLYGRIISLSEYNGEENVTVDLSTVKSGLYQLRINGFFVKPFVVKN